MKNFLLTLITLLFIGNIAQAQCDPTFTFAHADCDSVQFTPVSTGAQYTYSWDFGDGNFSTDVDPAHTYLTDAVYTAILVITDTVAGCTTTYTQVVNVNCGGACSLNPVITYNQNPSTCEVQFVQTTFGGFPPYVYYWDFGDGTYSTDPNPTHQYSNNSTFTACLTVTDSQGCTVGNICTFITTSCTQTSCDPMFTHNMIGCDSVQFFPVSTGSQYAYSWDFGDGGTSTDPNPIHVFADGTWVVNLVLSDTVAGCNDQTNLSIFIDCGYSPCATMGAISWNVDTTDCSVQFVSTAFNGTAPYTFFWQFGDGTTSSDPHPNHTYPNNSIWTPCLTITDVNGCDTVICDVVTVQCSPTSCDALFNFTHVACNELYFIPVSSGAQYTYLWDFGDGNTSTDSNPTHTYADGTFIITLTVSDTLSGCTDTWVQTVAINCGSGCTVDGVFTYNQDFNNCDVYFVSSAWGGQAPYTYFWDFGDGNTSTDINPIHQYPNNSVWTPCLTITDANGCDTTVCSVLTSSCSISSCDPNFTFSQIGCDSVQFFPVSMGTQYDYYWDFGDGGTSTEVNPIHVFADGTWIVTLVISDNIAPCNDQAIVTIVIDCGYSPCTTTGAISWAQDSLDCEIQFVSTAYGGTYPYTYFWQFGDGTTSTSPNPAHTYPYSGSWTPCLTITDANGCDTTICDVVGVNCVTPSCNAQFNFTHIDCNELYFVPFSTGAQFTYLWDFGDGNTSTDSHPTHTFADGTHIITLTISDSLSGCSDTYWYTVQINCGSGCTIEGVFTYNQNFSNCEVYFLSSVWGGQAPYTYYWDFGDGNTSTDANPTHQYPNNSVWTPCLTVTDANGCDTTFCSVITSTCTPISCDPTFTYTQIGCDSVQFFPATTGSQYTYQWDFGDGNSSTDTNPIHGYADGMYVVNLLISDTVSGCINQTVVTIVIDCGYSPCSTMGAISWAQDSLDCEIQFVSTAFGGTYPYTYYWQFGDGTTSTSPNPLHTYPYSGSWTPCLTITDANGCDTTICDVVGVNCIPPPCDASFNFTHIGCDELYFIPFSTGANFSYFWDFGDGNTSTDAQPTHTFAGGIHVITLTITDSLSGCSDTWWYTVQIDCGTPCTVNGVITYNQDFNNCNVYFASSAWGGQAPYTYQWNFGDGNTSSDMNPTHQYPNNTTWTPCLTITDANGCDTTICTVITVTCTAINCDATFTNTYVACDSVWFLPAINDSSLTYLWDFGDGNTSTDIDPVHHYGANGTYTVVLYISDPNTGCNNAYTAVVGINCNATPCNIQAVTTWQPDSACSIWMISSAWGGTAPYSYYWNFGDGNTSSDAHPTHIYPYDGAWTPCLTVTDANGCDTTVCMVVTVNNCTSGIATEENNFEVSIYPNPSTGIYNMYIPNDAKVDVYDFSGQLVYSDHEMKADGLYTFDLSNVDSGVYMVRINSELGATTERLVKQ